MNTHFRLSGKTLATIVVAIGLVAYALPPGTALAGSSRDRSALLGNEAAAPPRIDRSSAPEARSSISQAAPDGSALYAQHCSSCHAETKKHRPAAATQSAIDHDMGKMGSLKFLTPAQVAAIAAAR